MGKLTELATGKLADNTSTGEFTNAMNSIKKSLSAHENELSRYWKKTNNSTDPRVFSSCSRMILEQGSAAIIGRLDPIRLITIAKGSSSVDFKIGQRNASSFIWNKDVIPDIKPIGGSYWTQESISKGIHRSLFEGHLADYIFSSAHDSILDSLTEEIKKAPTIPHWIIEILKIEKGEAILSKLRKSASEAYSTLSKGIHFEFFLGRETQPNIDEIKKATSLAVYSIATTSLYTHLSDIGINKIGGKIATKNFITTIGEYQYNG